MNARLQQFAEAVERPEDSIELDRAAALLGAIAGDGSTGIDQVQVRLDAIAAQAAREPPASDGPAASAELLRSVLAGELGLRGDGEDYYDPRNSFLHSVLERRRGIPISLSVLYLEVARRLGLRARGVGFPGHFLVSLEGPGERLFLDPFHGGAALDELALTALLQRSRGPDARVEAAMLEPVGPKAILQRMLQNLAGIYGKRNDWLRSLAVLERLQLLDPGNERIERALADLRARAKTLN